MAMAKQGRFLQEHVMTTVTSLQEKLNNLRTHKP
jgi:hypothetical protein